MQPADYVAVQPDDYSHDVLQETLPIETGVAVTQVLGILCAAPAVRPGEVQAVVAAISRVAKWWWVTGPNSN